MFGLNEITWNVFACFLTLALCAWYGVVVLYAWMKTKTNRNYLFENGNTENGNVETVNPIQVLSKEFPQKLLSTLTETQISFEVLRYEESHENEGLNLNLFLEENNGKLEEVLPGIQHQC